MTCVLLSGFVVVAAVLPSVSRSVPSVAIWLLALVVYALAVFTILASWAVWSMLIGLMLTVAGAEIQPKWLMNSTGQWIPWLLAGITILSVYQLLLVPGLMVDHVAVKPANFHSIWNNILCWCSICVPKNLQGQETNIVSWRYTAEGHANCLHTSANPAWNDLDNIMAMALSHLCCEQALGRVHRRRV